MKKTLNIRNTDADKRAKALADLTGEAKTRAVTRALQEPLQREQRRLVDALTEIADHCAGLPRQDTRAADEILGYDDRGLAR